MSQEWKNQYLRAIIERRGYLLKSKQEKSKLLDEYCQTTGQNRDYVIRKIQDKGYLSSGFEKEKKYKYDEEFKQTLIRIWEIFGYPCGQALERLLKSTTAWLRIRESIEIPDEIVQKLKEITSSTIDLKLRDEKEGN